VSAPAGAAPDGHGPVLERVLHIAYDGLGSQDDRWPNFREGDTLFRESRLRVPAEEDNVKLPTLMRRPVVRRARGVRAIRTLLAGAMLFCAFASPVSVQAAPKGKDKREIKAREAFAEGRYQDALDLFTKLYAEKPHPTYQRNIGRCYQNLQQPDKAIDAFRAYLSEGKDISPAETKEVEGFIAEMETLKKKQEEGQAASAPFPPKATSPIPVPAAPPVEASHGSTAETASLTEAPSEPSPEGPQPSYKSGWLWGLVGGVVLVAVAGSLYAAGVFSRAGQCPSGVTCKNLGGN